MEKSRERHYMEYGSVYLASKASMHWRIKPTFVGIFISWNEVNVEHYKGAHARPFSSSSGTFGVGGTQVAIVKRNGARESSSQRPNTTPHHK